MKTLTRPRVTWRRAAISAAIASPALAALAFSPVGASAATSHPAAHHVAATDPQGVLCLYYSQGCGAELTAEGNGNQAQISTNGATLTQSNCGFINGAIVAAWKNNNGLWVHWKSSNGFVTFETDSTNGCSNNADKWVLISAGGPGGPNVYGNYSNVNDLLGTNGDTSGSKVFASQSPGWDKWN